MTEKSADRKLVLLPGMDGMGSLFEPFIEALPESFEAIPVRYPANLPLSYPELAELIRKRLPVSEPFVPLAESFSTPLAVQIAAAQPAGLKALILVAGFITCPKFAWLPQFGALLLPRRMKLRMPDLVVRRNLLGPAAPLRLLQEVKAAVLSMSAEVFASRLTSISQCNARAELAKVAVPILYLQAMNDRVVKVRSLEEIVAIRNDVTVAKIEGPHLLLQRKPRQAAEIVTEFINQLL